MSAGRPRASSRDTLADAACELFLEQGFDATSIVDITSRAGVSRSSFFNYFASKSDILWAGLDERIAALEVALDAADIAGAPAAVHRAVMALANEFSPDPLALAIVNAQTMGLDDELIRESSLRRARIARAVTGLFVRSGADRLSAEVSGSAWGGAVLAAVDAWARDGAGRTPIRRFIERAAAAAAGVGAATESGAVRQLRLVVHASEFEEALSFYRDGAGMPQAEAYEADGGARVVILDAGRATLELANSAQVSFIDSVETDGDAPSDRLRVALEVGDTAAAVERLVAAGAEVEASARETPWRSINARLRAPADLQVTLFQELGPPRD
ncbi:TetR family transcriptional regulator [Microbacterium lacus]|uniref:TetR family transcriptional regulator n=1 Tax=Microbacterium lacus TaxID=415217 RepID=UPI0038514BEF